jgi:carboxyl-terminal processing protease
MQLAEQDRIGILAAIKKQVLRHHFNSAGVNYDEWLRVMADRTPALLAGDTAAFEHGVQQLLEELGGSHTVFYHESANRFLPQHTINASLRRFGQTEQAGWTFLDVFEDGPAHVAGIRPGDFLIAVDGAACEPTVMPRFLLGQTYQLTVSSPDGGNRRDVPVAVPARKGTKERPPIVEPKSITHSLIPPNVGVLRIAHFSGALGMRFTRGLDAAISDLKQRGADRLIVDLRGNIGGSLGFARLASYMCPGRVPIGNSLTPKRQRAGYHREALPKVPMPRNKMEAVWTMGRYALRDKSVMLMTQGLGPQPFHGKIVILVNEWTNSAAEMLTSFAVEHNLARVLGTKTAGNVLGAVNFRVGSGYWFRLPIFGWFTSRGESLEGKGVEPHITVDVEPCQLSAGIDQQMEKAVQVLAMPPARRASVTLPS